MGKHMNVVIFASDSKHLSYLNNIITVASNNNLNIFAMICHDTRLKHPLHHKNRYEILTNCSESEITFSETLGVNLPFKPDWLILSRERWEPETSIIKEFKQKFKCKIAMVEPNSAMINGVNNFLETKSKNQFADKIDVWFDHSEFIKNQRKLLGFKGKNIIVVGNPKYDSNLNIDTQSIDKLKQYYNVDPNKKQVLFFTAINKFRHKLFDEFKKFKNKHPEYQYFVKPYPGEPYDPLTKNDYFPKFFIEGVTPVLEETHIWGMFNICNIHIGSLGSVLYSSFFLDKEIHDFSKEIGLQDNLESNQDILDSKGGGEEDLNMWLRVFNLKLKDFKDLTSKDKMLPMMKNNDIIWKYLKDNVYYRKNILKLYDEFNDNQSSKRIIDFIKNN